MSKTEFRKRAGISSATFTKLRKNEEATLTAILKFTEVMQCNAGDMMDFIPNDLPAIADEVDNDDESA